MLNWAQSWLLFFFALATLFGALYCEGWLGLIGAMPTLAVLLMFYWLYLVANPSVGGILRVEAARAVSAEPHCRRSCTGAR